MLQVECQLFPLPQGALAADIGKWQREPFGLNIRQGASDFYGYFKHTFLYSGEVLPICSLAAAAASSTIAARLWSTCTTEGTKLNVGEMPAGQMQSCMHHRFKPQCVRQTAAAVAPVAYCLRWYCTAYAQWLPHL